MSRCHIVGNHMSRLICYCYSDGYRNRFVINIDDTSCDNWRGFLTILINDACAFNRSMKYPKILYTDSTDQPAFWNIDEGTPTTVNLDIFTRVLFSRNFAYAKFRENKSSRNAEITLSSTDIGKSCPCREFLPPQICL